MTEKREFVCRCQPCACLLHTGDVEDGGCGCESDDTGECLECHAPMYENEPER